MDNLRHQLLPSLADVILFTILASSTSNLVSCFAPTVVNEELFQRLVVLQMGEFLTPRLILLSYISICSHDNTGLKCI